MLAPNQSIFTLAGNSPNSLFTGLLATFATIGISDSDGNVAPNIYRWTWGSAADQSFTIDGVPLPAALPLFATGIGALGLVGWRRKRRAKAVA